MPNFSAGASSSPTIESQRNRFLLLVAGLGGLLYGVDVGIIGGALPYLEATSGLNAGQLSIIVAAVLLGSVFSTLFAGLLADWMGRRSLMILSGLTFVASIPIIALANGYGPPLSGTPSAGCQRWPDRCRRSSLSRGMSLCFYQRQGYGRLPVASHTGHLFGFGHRDLLQLSR